MSEDTSRIDDLNTLILHDQEDRPVLLRSKFIISVLGNIGDDNHTEVVVDGGGTDNIVHTVKETVEQITGPFARVSNLLINPAYFVMVRPNENASKDRFAWEILMSGPEQKTYISKSDPEIFAKAIRQARNTL